MITSRHERKCGVCHGLMEEKGSWLTKYYESWVSMALWQCLVCRNVEIEER